MSSCLSAELKSQVNSFLKRAFKYGFCSRLYTIDAIAEDADIDLFCKMTKTIISLILYYRLLNLVHTTSDPKGTHINSLGVIWGCIKSHLYLVASFSICNMYLCFYGICVFTYYFHCHFSTVHVRLLRVY